MSPGTLKQVVTTAINFLETNDIEISPRKFKLKVKLPRATRKNKQALSKDDVIHVLNSCSDIRLKTYILLLASTGMRPGEGLSLRIKDIDFKSNPARIFLRGEITKTKTDRTIFLTEETKKQLMAWIDYKYRSRRRSFFDKTLGKWINERKMPQKNDTDLLFVVHHKSTQIAKHAYINLVDAFGKTLDRINMGQKEESNKHHRRRRLTFHSFRRFVKTTISDLGYGDFSEYFIGHSGSTYYRKPEKEKIELFRKIEPHLTFLDYPTLERQGADIQVKMDILEEENKRLRQSDIQKEDALSALSDQVLKLMNEVQDMKKLRP